MSDNKEQLSDTEIRRQIERARYLYNPDDPSLRHVHPHGKEDYEHAGSKDLLEFAKNNQAQEASKKDLRTEIKNNDSTRGLPNRSTSNLSPTNSLPHLPLSPPAPPQIKSSASGTLNFLDCDGNNLGSISWINGLITTSGTLNISTGCLSYSS